MILLTLLMMGIQIELKRRESEEELLRQDEDGRYKMDLLHQQGAESSSSKQMGGKTKRKKTEESRNGEEAGNETKKPAGRPRKYITKEQIEEKGERKITRDQEDRANRSARLKRLENETKGYKNEMVEMISSFKLFKITHLEPLQAEMERFQNEDVEFQNEDLKLQNEFNKLAAEMELLQDERNMLIQSSLQHQITNLAFIEDLDKEKQRIQIDKKELKNKTERFQILNEELVGFIRGFHITNCKSCSDDLKVEFERLYNKNKESKLKTKLLLDEITEMKALIKELKPEIKKLQNVLNVEIENLQNEMKPDDYLDHTNLKPVKMKAEFGRRLKKENLRLENVNMGLNAELDRLKDQNELLACFGFLIINLIKDQDMNHPEGNKEPFPDQLRNIQANVEMGNMLEAKSDNIVKETLKLIEDNLMNDICDHSVENPDHFMAEVRKCYGKSPDNNTSSISSSAALEKNESQYPRNDHGKLPVPPYANEMWASFPNMTDMNCLLKVAEHDRCYACKSVENLTAQLNNAKRSTVNASDFMNFNEEWNRRDGNKIPPYLEYVHQGLNRDITAFTTFSDDMIELPRALFYAVIDEMGQKQLEEINEDVILKWGFVIRDAGRMNMDVEFAMEHLTKIAHAYFSMAVADKKELQALGDEISTKERTLDELKRSFHGRKETLEIKMRSICATEEAETFDGVPLSKGIFPRTLME